MSDTSLSKPKTWARNLGLFYLLATPFSFFTALMSGFALDTPGSETNIYVIVGVTIVAILPIVILAAAITCFVFHKKNKYITSAPISKFFIFLPLIPIILLAVMLAVFMAVNINALD